MCLDRCPRTSIPTSPITRTINGFNPCGCVPADSTSARPASNTLPNPSAIWLRHEFPVHKNNTRGNKPPCRFHCVTRSTPSHSTTHPPPRGRPPSHPPMTAAHHTHAQNARGTFDSDPASPDSQSPPLPESPDAAKPLKDPHRSIRQSHSRCMIWHTWPGMPTAAAASHLPTRRTSPGSASHPAATPASPPAKASPAAEPADHPCSDPSASRPTWLSALLFAYLCKYTCLDHVNQAAPRLPVRPSLSSLPLICFLAFLRFVELPLFGHLAIWPFQPHLQTAPIKKHACPKARVSFNLQLSAIRTHSNSLKFLIASARPGTFDSAPSLVIRSACALNLLTAASICGLNSFIRFAFISAGAALKVAT